jgi:hypothetical protein
MNRHWIIGLLCTITGSLSAQEVEYDTYLGQTIKGVYSGFGILDYADGSWYQGQFKAGKPDGVGTYTDKNGAQKSGIFSAGKWMKTYSWEEDWNQIDLYYYLPDTSVDVKTYSMDFELFDEVPANTSLTIATHGGGTINNISFWGGLQTDWGGYIHPKNMDDESQYQEIERSFNFTRWDETRTEALRLAPNGFCFVDDSEESTIGVSNKFNWKKGQYTITLYASDVKVTLDGKVHTFVGLKVLDKSNGKTTEMGMLAFPGEKLRFGAQMNMFVQVYNEKGTLEQTPKLSMAFTNFKLNDKLIEPKDVQTYFPYNMPHWAEASLLENGFRVEIGKPCKRNIVTFDSEQLICTPEYWIEEE